MQQQSSEDEFADTAVVASDSDDDMGPASSGSDSDAAAADDGDVMAQLDALMDASDGAHVLMANQRMAAQEHVT